MTGPPTSYFRRPVRTLLLPVYIAAVALAGAAVMGTHLTRLFGPETTSPLGSHPGAFLILAAALIVAELKPMQWLSKDDGGEITGSWAFAFALLFIAPPGAGLLVVAGACIGVELFHQKPPVRIAFNAAQLVLALTAGLLVLNFLTGGNPMIAPDRVGIRWLGSAIIACSVSFLLNSFLTALVLALHQSVPMWRTLHSLIVVNLNLDGLLMALAPVFTVVALHAIALVPLLLATVWSIHRGSTMAMTNRYEATHDLLTGIPNRRLFDEQAKHCIEEAQVSGELLALVLIDLDGFKPVNDDYGHHMGDLVLREAAARLNRHKRATDLVARIGGDEFAVLIRRLVSPDEATQAALRFHEALRQPMLIESVEITISGSFGVAVFPHCGSDLKTVLNQADQAMYHAKECGQGVFVAAGEPTRPWAQPPARPEVAETSEREPAG